MEFSLKVRDKAHAVTLKQLRVKRQALTIGCG